jgi:Yip1 domain
MTQASISDMVNQSREVLTKRSVATFETFENRGGLQSALIYMGIAAALSGVIGLSGGLRGLLTGVIGTLVGFLVFTYLVYYIGKSQGGTGTLDQVAYTFSLFYAPLSVIFSVLSFVLVITLVGIFFLPFLGILAIIANIYFAYLAVQSSMNLRDTSKVWLTLILAGIGSWVIGALLTGIFLRIN